MHERFSVNAENAKILHHINFRHLFHVTSTVACITLVICLITQPESRMLQHPHKDLCRRHANAHVAGSEIYRAQAVVKHSYNLFVPDALLAKSSGKQYAALRKYAGYLADFCEEVTPADAQQSVHELFEPICTMLDVLSGISGRPFSNPLRQSTATPQVADTSHLLQLVMTDVAFMCEAQGIYSFSFGPVSNDGAAKVYTSGSKVLAFAATSCYLQYHYDNAFQADLPI